MKTLSQLLPIPPEYDRPLRHLTLDSRAVQPGDLFCACQGLHKHGREFLPMALAQGAAAVLLEQDQENIELQQGVPCIGVPQLQQKLGALAARFYADPSRALQLIGVTGTNGKTSITHFLAQSLPQPAGLLGTLGYGVYGHLRTASHTTPDALRLQALLAELRDQGVQQVAMEVSSHALDQGRVADLAFKVAVLTNLSRDHLDYHGTLQAYAAAKAKLFHWEGLQTAVLNLDDAFGVRLLGEQLTAKTITYSLKNPQADLFVQQLEKLVQGGYVAHLHTPQGAGVLHTSLPGLFNLSNLLATLGVLLSLDMSLARALAQLAQVQPVAGRMESFRQPGCPTVVVDYAHTPDALEQVLSALRPHCAGRLYCVFGCGGERDTGKRPLMGAIAEQLADLVIITNDNPRHEDPQHIVRDIVRGLRQPQQVRVMTDRAAAIAYSIAQAKAQDWVLIAGKGHEDYQQVGEQRLPFSDQQQVQAALQVRLALIN